MEPRIQTTLEEMFEDRGLERPECRRIRKLDVGVAKGLKEADHPVVVVYDTITTGARKMLAPCARVELFQKQELLFNVTKHDLVPRHRKLSNEEQQEVLRKYRVTALKLPKIKKDDPVTRYFQGKVGEVFEITREHNGDLELYYRIVVD